MKASALTAVSVLLALVLLAGCAGTKDVAQNNAKGIASEEVLPRPDDPIAALSQGPFILAGVEYAPGDTLAKLVENGWYKAEITGAVDLDVTIGEAVGTLYTNIQLTHDSYKDVLVGATLYSDNKDLNAPALECELKKIALYPQGSDIPWSLGATINQHTDAETVEEYYPHLNGINTTLGYEITLGPGTLEQMSPVPYVSMTWNAKSNDFFVIHVGFNVEPPWSASPWSTSK